MKKQWRHYGMLCCWLIRKGTPLTIVKLLHTFDFLMPTPDILIAFKTLQGKTGLGCTLIMQVTVLLMQVNSLFVVSLFSFAHSVII